MKKPFMLVLLAALLLAGCGKQTVKTQEAASMNITAEEAKKLMDSESGYVILDVRTEQEYAESHIPGSILIPDYEISEKAESVLTDKDQLILVYCRSGNRSKQASEKLVKLGYTNIVEIGGINSWPGETVTGDK